MKDFSKKHTFVICAYKESPFLEECIVSLKKQTCKSNIIIVTSTPNAYISRLGEKYEIEVEVNTGEAGIVQDWNFGYSQCQTPYITIAHQDDIYMPHYAERAVEHLEKSKKPLIYFSDYCELRNGRQVRSNKLLFVKRVLLSPLRVKVLQKSRFVRRMSLAFGNGICCPAVSFAAKNLPDKVFTVGFRSCEDWEAWERLSRMHGEFLYDPQILMAHRIHEGSETSIIIGDNARSKEDYEMFCRFWPKWFAKILIKFYSASEKSNEVN